MEIEIQLKAKLLVDKDTDVNKLKDASCELKITFDGVTYSPDVQTVRVTDVKRHLNYNFTLVKSDGVICLSENCQYRQSCAQHATAGDFRTEGGFSPRLKKEGESLLCQSINMPSIEEEGYGYDPKPVEHHDQGMMVLKKGKFISEEDWDD